MAISKALSVALALSVVPSTLANSHAHPTNNFRHRRQSVPASLPGNWTHQGCFTDNVSGLGRTLNSASFANGTGMTIESCIKFCESKNLIFAGVEFGDECYCDNNIHFGTKVAATDCNMPCSGNQTELCGAGNRLNIFWNGTAPPPPPATVPKVGIWNYAGCWVDGAHGRILETGIDGTQSNTVQSCVDACAAQNFTVAGTEFGDECYCGNRLVNGAVIGDESTCNKVCAGNASQICGGPDRLSVYSTGNFTVFPVPVAKNTSLPGNWTYHGCYADTNERVLPWQIILPTNNTAEACLNQCSTFGYSAAGMEFGRECYCGDAIDVVPAGNKPEPDCNVPCTGDPGQLCGGGLRLQMYTWPGDLNTWHTPANTGRYEFFVPGLIVPLIATLGINDKVTFLEKSGTSEFPNATGAYELDPTLVHNFSATWREMHVKTDVFCAGSIILPDKAGRQINVGGWSLDSTFGVRLYTPDGSAGVNGTNDWEEDGHLLKLQRGRWYPTAAMLPNGSVLVMGGEIGSNDKAQPNLEILPKPDGGDTVVELDFLARTDPLNLYPFITVLPSGHIFVAYYNEARILDAKTFQTIRTLPNMPAAVNKFDGGRTYPLQGSMMLFPQHAPYNDPLKVLICGGSTPQPAEVLDNCVSIEPEVPNANWTIERMPSQRVMPNMVALPDGTFMIVNGAKKGFAGFGLASDPNLETLLYDPTLPVRQRISRLNTTIVPRLYHSEAILLTDARVLISGSDPQTPGFNEETRVEVYIPPYLNQGFRQPEFSVPNNDWDYGGKYMINNIKLFQGRISNVRISLVAAVSSTHGNTMGSRTIFPAFSCSGTQCTITAPPNAFVSPPGWHQLFILDGPTPSFSKWVRIGGDPAQIGNWPQLPGFHPPGV